MEFQSEFRSKCEVGNGKWANLTIDPKVAYNYASPYVVERLGLNTIDHPHPYFLPDLKSGKTWFIHRQVIVCFNMGPLKEVITCDVIPMTDLHIVLGEQWMWDRRVVFNSIDGSYTATTHQGIRLRIKNSPWMLDNDIVDQYNACARLVKGKHGNNVSHDEPVVYTNQEEVSKDDTEQSIEEPKSCEPIISVESKEEAFVNIQEGNVLFDPNLPPIFDLDREEFEIKDNSLRESEHPFKLDYWGEDERKKTVVGSPLEFNLINEMIPSKIINDKTLLMEGNYKSPLESYIGEFLYGDAGFIDKFSAWVLMRKLEDKINLCELKLVFNDLVHGGRQGGSKKNWSYYAEWCGCENMINKFEVYIEDDELKDDLATRSNLWLFSLANFVSKCCSFVFDPGGHRFKNRDDSF